MECVSIEIDKNVLPFAQPAMGYASSRANRRSECAWILIPVVPAAVADEHAAVLLNLPNQVAAFHAIWNPSLFRAL